MNIITMNFIHKLNKNQLIPVRYLNKFKIYSFTFSTNILINKKDEMELNNSININNNNNQLFKSFDQNLNENLDLEKAYVKSYPLFVVFQIFL